jgi:hypothetical protein
MLKPKVKLKAKLKKSASMPPMPPAVSAESPAPDVGAAPAGAPYKRGGKTKACKRGGKC